MKSRCGNPNTPGYADYGGRGITVCERWLDFENFFADMGERPENTTVHRPDSNGNYVPGNCVWATDKTQGREKRQSIWVEFDGKMMPLMEVSEITGRPYGTLIYRAKKGLPLDAVNLWGTNPNPLSGKDHPMFGKTHSPETRAKLSASHTGMKRTPEHAAAISAANKGRVLSEEHKEKGRLAKLGAKNPMFGVSPSAETREKIAAAHRGKPKSPESIAKMLETRRRNKASKLQVSAT